MIQKIMTFAISALLSTQVYAADIQLPAPETNGTVPLMTALKNRHSDHAFANKDMTAQDLSNLLWVAYGITRPDGKRTIPTARNEMDLAIYVFNKDGIYRYDANGNTLVQISDKNQLSLFQRQDYMANVPVVFVYTGKNLDYAPLHAGSAYQNVGLYTATNQMASIIRGMFDKEGVKKAIGLPDDEYVLISQAIGWK